MLAKRLLIIVFFGLLSSITYACSLPAEPSAALVPIATDGEPQFLQVESETESNSYYYLVPEGSRVKFRLAWNPAVINSGDDFETGKHDWCTKAGYPFLPGAPRIDDYGYFDIKNMADFFSVSGNRSDISEAFSIEIGADTGNKFIRDDFGGPSFLLRQFIKGGQTGRLETLSGTCSSYGDSRELSITLNGITEVPSSAIDPAFPSEGWNINSIDVENEDDPIDVFMRDDDNATAITDPGMVLEDLTLNLTDITVNDYKAYIAKKENSNVGIDDKASRIHLKSNPTLRTLWVSDRQRDIRGTSGIDGEHFDITFTTPTYNGDLESSKIRFEIYAPPAGIEMGNLYWAWEETAYERIPDEDPENPSPPLWRKVDNTPRKCSQEIFLTVIKEAVVPASTDFIVYDTKPPIATELTIVAGDDNNTFEESESGSKTVKFSLKIIDSNPYFKEEIETGLAHDNSSSGTVGEQKLDKFKSGLRILYTYPVYKYETKENIPITNVQNDSLGYGILEPLEKTLIPEFKSFDHKAVWTWQEAEVNSIEFSESAYIKKNGKIVGSVTNASGTFILKQPYPWHMSTKGSTNAISSPEPIFKVLAICGDTADNFSDDYDIVDNYSNPSPFSVPSPNSNTAAPDYEVPGSPAENDGIELAFSPETGEVIPANITENIKKEDIDLKLSDTAGGSSVESYSIFSIASITETLKSWSNVQYLGVKDTIEPEIQVIVFDTRSNKYHVFGNGDGVAREFAVDNKADSDEAFKEASYSDPALEIPYIDKGEGISNGHKFIVIDDSLFSEYLQDGEPVAGLSGEKGFVCQRNTRLIFYIRALDNINTYNKDYNYGISSLKYTIEDGLDHLTKALGEVTDGDGKMMAPVEHVFRYADTKPYRLSVTAKDHSGNEQVLDLDFKILERSLDIRTLEERRRRID